MVGPRGERHRESFGVGSLVGQLPSLVSSRNYGPSLGTSIEHGEVTQ